MNHNQALELIPLYALSALEVSEDAEVASHLETCPICRAELDSNREVAASLTTDTPAPSGVWARIEAELDSGDVEGVVIPLENRRTRSWAKWTMGAAAAAALVVVGVLVGQNSTSNDLSAEAAIVEASDVASAEPGSLVADFLVDGEAVARVVVSEDGTGFLIPNENLPTLSPDRAYQLWVITPDELVISAGLLGNDPRPALFTWTDDIAGFALTREVAGGVISSAGDVVSVITET
jgi:anti-sigma-K factor RskA